MTDKEIRNKMYLLFRNMGKKFNPNFDITKEERATVKEIMDEYKDFFNSQPMKVEFFAKEEVKKESTWKPYPQTKF